MPSRLRLRRRRANVSKHAAFSFILDFAIEQYLHMMLVLAVSFQYSNVTIWVAFSAISYHTIPSSAVIPNFIALLLELIFKLLTVSQMKSKPGSQTLSSTLKGGLRGQT